MEEKDSAISGPYEEFRICFCGKIPSGSVEWYLIDVSVEEACLSEKTESSTRELIPFSVAKHLPSYAALGGLIYSLGGQRRSHGGGDTLLNDVWLLDFKFLEDLKPGSIPPLSPSLSFRDELAPGEKNWQPERKTSELRVEDREPTKIDSGVGDDIAETKLVPGRKPGSGKAARKYKLGSGKAQSQMLPSSYKARSRKSSEEVRDADDSPGKAWSFKSSNSEEVRGGDESKPRSGKARAQNSSSKLGLSLLGISLPLPDDVFPDSDEIRPPLQLQFPHDVLPDSDEISPTPCFSRARLIYPYVAFPHSNEIILPPRLQLPHDVLPGSDEISPTPCFSRAQLPLRHDILPDSDEVSPTPLTAASVEDWKPGLRMKYARYNPHTMVVDHKLYVLGGFLPNQNQADGWMEVFDPEEKKWESLPSPPDQIHSSIMISGLLKSKKEIIIARQRWDCHPLLFYSYNITTRCWNELSLHSDSKASVHSNVERAVILPPNIGRAVTVGNTLYWISTKEDNHECTISAYDLDRNMWFEDHLKTARIFGEREYFSSIYSRGPGFLHLVDQKFCLLLQSSVMKKDPQLSIEYLYCVILDISPIYDHEHEDWGKFELTTVSVQKYSMDHYIDFLDCMLLERSTTQPQFPRAMILSAD